MTKRGSERRAEKFALVKWITGAYADTMTHNVKISWIKDFQEENYHAAADESYIIEWRVPPQPKAGWPLFDGVVLEISGTFGLASKI